MKLDKEMLSLGYRRVMSMDALLEAMTWEWPDPPRSAPFNWRSVRGWKL